MSAHSLLAVCVVLVLGGCSCEEERRPASPSARTTTEGGDEGLLEPFGDTASAPRVSRFVAIDVAEGREAARARSWSGAAALRGASDRDDPGNWLCRLWALYGEPPALTDDGFRYVLRDTELDYVLVAYLDSRGPSMGAVITNEAGHRIGDEDRIARSVEEFVQLVEATRPIDCELEVGGGRIGVAGERSLP